MVYRGAIIGTAGVGRQHAEAYDSVEGIELVAIAGPGDDELAEFGETWAIPTADRYTDHRAMLEAETLDVVSVSTPAFRHRDHVVDAAEIGDPDAIWCEKPIAESVSDATEMVTACDDAGIELVVNHPRRFTETYRRLRRLLCVDRLLGDVSSFNLHFNEELLREGAHTVDLLLYLLDAQAERVGGGYLTGRVGDPLESSADAVDWTFDDCGGGGVVLLEDGTFATVEHIASRSATPRSFRIVGSKGVLSVVREPWEWAYQYRTVEDGEYVEAELPEALSELWSLETLFDDVAAHLVDLLDGNAPNRSSGDEARRGLEILVGLFVSHHMGTHVSLPLQRPLRDVTIRTW